MAANFAREFLFTIQPQAVNEKESDGSFSGEFGPRHFLDGRMLEIPENLSLEFVFPRDRIEVVYILSAVRFLVAHNCCSSANTK